MTLDPLSNIGGPNLVGKMQAVDDIQQALQQQILSQAVGNPTAAQQVRNADVVELRKVAGNKIDTKGQPSLATQAQTDPPRGNYSQKQAQAGQYFYTPVDQAGRVQLSDGKAKGKPFSAEHLSRSLDKCKDPERKASFMREHGIAQAPNGQYFMPVQANNAAAAAFMPGQATNQIGSSSFDFLNRNSWLMPTLGFMTGGIGGLAAGFITSKALKSVSGGMSSSGMGALAPGFAGISGLGTMSPSSYLGNIAGTGGFGTMAGAAQMMGLEGMAFTLRKQMASAAEDMMDSSMIAEINNPGIPIEDLIFMFMARMGDKYEKKLREKMEETAMAEKRERQRERKTEQARMIGGIASLIPGVGPLIGAGVQMAAQESIRIDDALNGSQKSSTILMQEVQMLMHKWKQLNEMLSNLMKSLHDMAMTPIRNLR